MEDITIVYHAPRKRVLLNQVIKIIKQEATVSSEYEMTIKDSDIETKSEYEYNH